jgi:hypothetical protein
VSGTGEQLADTIRAGPAAASNTTIRFSPFFVPGMKIIAVIRDTFYSTHFFKTTKQKKTCEY